MIINNYTLEHLVNSLGALTGTEITDCFSQEKDVLMICFDTGRGEVYLQFNTNSKYCSLYMKSEFHRARANTTGLMPELSGEIVQGITLLPGNRIIRMSLINSKLYFLLYGSAKTNLVMTDTNNTIINSFKSSAELKGGNFSEPESRLRNFEDFAPDDSIFNALSKSSLMLGKYYAAEIIAKSGISPEMATGELTEQDKSRLAEHIRDYTEKLKKSNEYSIIETENKNVLLTLSGLSDYPKVIETHNDINKAIERRVVYSIKHDGFYRSYSQSGEKLKGLIRKLKANIVLYSDSSDAVEREKQYRQYAEVLSAQPNIKDKPGSSVDLDYWDGSRITVPLDPKLNIMQNSGRYFEKARKAKESVIHRKKLLPGLEKQLAEAESKLAELEQAHSMKDIEKIGNKGKTMQDNNDNSSKYKVFELAEGFTLYVGKSAANNDELTMKFAKPNDLWLHARGSSGSHCVLRAAKDEKIPKEILRKAAEIAAYYSKSRNAKYTPVAYTYKKFVRKPKGADTGSVTMQREEVIMVEPKLPEGETA